MGRKQKLCYTATALSFFIFIKVLFYEQLNISDNDFTKIELCPACYGNNLCPQFYHSDITLIGSSKLKYFGAFNSKNVFTGKYGRKRVILKKLAHDWEIREKDELLCQLVNEVKYCDAKNAMELIIKKTLHEDKLINMLHVFNSFNSETDISHCSSERLLSYMFSKVYSPLTNFTSEEHISIFKLGEMMYSLLLNPEAVILQAFSQAEGWPFPHYYGACGRVIVEEYVGLTLAQFEDAPWKQRIDIAYQLLLIAQMLTENVSQFAFYMTDVNMDNFAVQTDNRVILIDVEGMVIVDHFKAKKGKKSSRKLHQSKGEFCKDCLNFSYEELCSYDLSDHNYYAICKGLLVPQSYYSAKGFLHDVPERIDAISNMSAMLKECADPSEPYGRFHIVPKILQVMKSLL